MLLSECPGGCTKGYHIKVGGVKIIIYIIIHTENIRKLIYYKTQLGVGTQPLSLVHSGLV